MNRLVLFLILTSFVFYGLSGCAKKDSSSPNKSAGKKGTADFHFFARGKVVAKVNNIPIGLDDLNQEIEIYNSMVPADSPELKISTLEKKIDYLKNEMVRRTLLYQVALDRKLDKEEDYIEALEKAKLDILVMELVKREAEDIDLTSREIEDYYNTYKDRFRAPEEISIREIVVPSESEAKDILGELSKGKDFSSLAKSRSKSKSAGSGGSLGFISGEGLFKNMADAASMLPIGKPSVVFQGPEGYYIIIVEARRKGEQIPFAQAQEDIRRGLTFLKQQQRIEEIIAKSASQSKIEVYEKEVK